MVERLGEMRKGRRERIEKGSREKIEKRERVLRVRQVRAQASKFSFYKLIECIINKICHDMKQNAVPLVKLEVIILDKNLSEEKEGMVEREKREV